MSTSFEVVIDRFKGRVTRFVSSEFTSSKRNGYGSENFTKKFCKNLNDLEILGEGLFGVVVGINSRLVAKVIYNKRRSVGYLKYARFCNKNYKKNKLLPKIYKVFSVKGVAFVIMERLDFAKSGDCLKSKCNSIRNGLESDTEKKVEKAIAAMERWEVCHKSLMMVKPQIDKIISSSKDSDIDIHEGNLMIRVNKRSGERRVVLTDPISY